MQITENITETFTRLTCCTCGVFFFLSSRFIEVRREDGKNFYCVNGHAQCYGEGETKKLQRQLEERERQLRESKCDTLRAQNELMEEAKIRGKAERKLKRVHRGVCPDCNRTFENLARHMQCKHGVKPQLLLAEKVD